PRRGELFPGGQPTQPCARRRRALERCKGIGCLRGVEWPPLAHPPIEPALRDHGVIQLAEAILEPRGGSRELLCRRAHDQGYSVRRVTEALCSDPHIVEFLVRRALTKRVHGPFQLSPWSTYKAGNVLPRRHLSGALQTGSTRCSDETVE